MTSHLIVVIFVHAWPDLFMAVVKRLYQNRQRPAFLEELMLSLATEIMA